MAARDGGGRRKSVGMSLTTPAQFDSLGRRLKKVQYENTYRMEPKVPFPVDRATAVIKEAMEMRLSGVTYEPEKCIGLSKTLANDIKEHIKELFVGLFSLLVTYECRLLDAVTAKQGEVHHPACSNANPKQ